MNHVRLVAFTLSVLFFSSSVAFAKAEWWKPYSAPRTERENVFAFSEKPSIKLVDKDKYEITFAVKGYCDVAVAIVDPSKDLTGWSGGTVIRHIGAGVLGSNAPRPFQKGSHQQKIYWNGKDDLDVYVKEPQKMKLRVMLGLKPEFDKRLGGTSGNNLPGYVWGIVIGPKGAYVFVQGSVSHQHLTIRKFDHDGKYMQSLTPHPANLPESKLKGLSYIEYEPGKKAVHGVSIRQSTQLDNRVFLKFVGDAGTAACQPALTGGKLFIAQCFASDLSQKNPPMPTKMVYIYTDGSTDVRGSRGRPLVVGRLTRPFFTGSPDGKTVYLSGIDGRQGNLPVVMSCSADGAERAKIFVGDPKSPGPGNGHLRNPRGLDCDAQNRLYIADSGNSRIQVFSPEGKHLKSIPIDRPEFVCVHKKTGAIYVLQRARVKGRSKGRLTKLGSFKNPKEEFHVDGLWGTSMALDSWSSKPRVWLAGNTVKAGLQAAVGTGPSVRIFEEQNKKLKQILDFDEVARKEAGKSYFGAFTGASSDQRAEYGPSKTICDPTREKLYYRHRFRFDLKTGNYEGQFRVIDRIGYDDIAFDKKGYMHGHSTLNIMPKPCLGRIWRVDPGQAKLMKFKTKGAKNQGVGPIYFYPEAPYNYGIIRPTKVPTPWTGVIPTEDQYASHGFQHGFGVNMRGDTVNASRITYVPKMEDEVKNEAFAGYLLRGKERGYGGGPGEALYAQYKRNIKDMLKRGDVFFIRREPGIPLWGETIWIYDASGERRYPHYSAVLGSRVAGVQIDEDGNPYFTTTSRRMVNGKPFLGDRGGTLGMPKDKKNKYPKLGTFMKTNPQGTKILLKNAKVLMDPMPTRPPELQRGGRPNWIEGSKWMYAGVSPILQGGCECPSSRSHLDWYKRSFVPEAYRHSIGVLDTNGNLIMHLGKYGNFDSGLGDKSKIPVGGDNIGMFSVRYIGGTDNYLCFDVWGEQLMVLKLNYHAVETTKISVE